MEIATVYSCYTARLSYSKYGTAKTFSCTARREEMLTIGKYGYAFKRFIEETKCITSVRRDNRLIYPLSSNIRDCSKLLIIFML